MIKKFELLIDKFKKTPKLEMTPPTFMEIAGYPHYENVCSNILSFFFDTTENHNCGDLFLTALYECLSDINPKSDNNTISVSREVLTDKNKRIDIVIETETSVIAIENKIKAPLYNDLIDYSKHLENYYQEKDEKIKIVLSLNIINDTELSGKFENVTHSQLYKRIKDKLGSKIIEANPKYLSHLIDFIETIENHTKPEAMNEEMLSFFIEEKETIEKLIAEQSNIAKYIYKKVLKVRSLVDIEGTDLEPGIWRKYVLYYDIAFEDGVTVRIDCYFEVDGIGIYVWVRIGEKDKIEYLKNLEIFTDFDVIENTTLIVQKKDTMKLTTTPEEIALKLNKVLDRIKKKK